MLKFKNLTQKINAHFYKNDFTKVKKLIKGKNLFKLIIKD